jgi:hypothetical protein
MIQPRNGKWEKKPRRGERPEAREKAVIVEVE